MRLLHFVEDLILIIALMAGSLFAVLVFNPPTIAEQTYCQAVVGGGPDYAACVIERTF